MSSSIALLEPLLDLLPLDHLPRTGWVLRGISTPESVAGHILGTAHLALALAPRVSPPLDLGRTLAMALLHDAPEARSGDLPRPASAELPAGAKVAMEDSIAESLIGGMGPLPLAHWQEYGAGESREARFVRICDRLQLGVRLVGYLRAGARGLSEFAPALADLDCSDFRAAGEMQAEILRAVEDAVTNR
ncbi:MAG: putative hydrolase of HD superfamily [Chlamydiales bacterium]|jgi:putative hydrolase of HD superfamily